MALHGMQPEPEGEAYFNVSIEFPENGNPPVQCKTGKFCVADYFRCKNNTDLLKAGVRVAEIVCKFFQKNDPNPACFF
jgi:hypothetical protein